MITHTKIRGLENKLNHKYQPAKQLVTRDITSDGRKMSKDGYLLSKKEILLQDKEDKIIRKNGGSVISIVHYYEPKSRISVQ